MGATLSSVSQICQDKQIRRFWGTNFQIMMLIEILLLFGKPEEDEDEGRDAHDKGIEQVGNDGKGGDAGKGRAHEQLCAVWQDALDDAGRGVKQAGGAGG